MGNRAEAPSGLANDDETLDDLLHSS